MPGFEGVAPAVAVDVCADPPAGAAVEVEEVGGGVDELEALLCDGLDVIGGDPNTVGGINLTNRSNLEIRLTEQQYR